MPSITVWDADDKVAFLKCALDGTAGQAIWDSGNPDDLTFDQLALKLRQRYGSVGQAEKYQAELKARKAT